MGKKGKTGKGKGYDCGLSKSALQNILTELLQKCVHAPGSNSNEKDLLTSHRDLRESLSRLTDMQKTSQISRLTSRKEKLQSFVSWLQEKNLDMSKCTLYSVPDLEDEFGLKALDDLDESSVFLRVPQSVMLHSELVQQSSFYKPMANDPMLSGMPNVALAMFLIYELYNKESQWKAYIDVLPRTFKNVLFFSVEDFLLLRGSPSLREGLNLWKSIVRQYCYLYLLLLKQTEPSLSKIAESFSFEDYRWAVAVVMTRENLIPKGSSNSTGNIALIPLLDMCNHCNAKQSIDFDDASRECICYAPKHVKSGTEIRIFYGPRPNSELVLHNGFFSPSNFHDSYKLNLSLGKTDPDRQLKGQVLAIFGLSESSQFFISKRPNPICDSLAFFARVFCAGRKELEQVHLECMKKTELAVKQGIALFSEETKTKANTFLKNRVLIVLKSFPDSLETDDNVLSSNSLSQITRNIVQLRRTEKLILQDALSIFQPNCDES